MWGMAVPYLAPTITIPTNAQGTFIFPRGPEWFSYPYAGSPYIGMKVPPPLFSTSPESGPAESQFKPLYAGFESSKLGLLSILLIIGLLLFLWRK